MKIGIDCRHLNFKFKEGINTYTFGLINGFQYIDKKIEFVIFVNLGQKKIIKSYIKNKNIKILEIGNSIGPLRKLLLILPVILNSVSLWTYINNIYYNLSGINKFIETNCSILYTPTTVLNTYNLNIPTVVSMHDIQHVHFRKYFSNLELILRNLKFKSTINNVNFIQASSSFIKKDLNKNFPSFKIDNIIVISEGVDINKFKEDNIKLFNSSLILPKNFIFYPAQTWFHKNHITILKALLLLKKRNINIPLIMCGSKKSAHNSIIEFIKSNKLENVFHLGIVSDEELLFLYKKCKFLITASIYESSSLPILEAAAVGVNVIASKTEPNLEIASKLKINLYEKYDHIFLSELLVKLYNKNSEQKNLKNINYNKDIIKEYSWAKIAELYVEFFLKINHQN